MHRAVITPNKKGGVGDFFEEHCSLFEHAGGGEHTLEQYELYQEYEKLIEQGR